MLTKHAGGRRIFMKIINLRNFNLLVFIIMHTVKIYPAIALTHAKTEAERNYIRALISWLQTSFKDVEITLWAFDLATWTPIKVQSVKKHDLKLLAAADLPIFFYLQSAGSDGRGGESRMAVEWNKSMLAFKTEGVGISQFPVDDMADIGVVAQEFKVFEDMRPTIQAAISSILAEKKFMGEQLAFFAESGVLVA